MSHSTPDQLQALEILEQRVREEGPALVVRIDRMVQEAGTSEAIVQDVYRRIWKFRDRQGLDRPAVPMCLSQCVRYMENAPATDKHKIDADEIARQFHLPLSSEEKARCGQYEVGQLWYGLADLLDREELRKSKAVHTHKRLPARAIWYGLGFLIIAALVVFNYSRPPAREASGHPPTIVARTESGERTDLLFPNGVRVWIEPTSTIQYSSDLQAIPLWLMLEGEAAVEVPEVPASPVQVRADHHVFYLSHGRYRIAMDSEQAEASIEVVEGRARWSGTVHDHILEVPAGHILIIRGDGKPQDTNLIESGNATDWP